jgi:hypothetical protein
LSLLIVVSSRSDVNKTGFNLDLKIDSIIEKNDKMLISSKGSVEICDKQAKCDVFYKDDESNSLTLVKLSDKEFCSFSKKLFTVWDSDTLKQISNEKLENQFRFNRIRLVPSDRPTHGHLPVILN